MSPKAMERPPWTQTVAFGLTDSDCAAMDRRRRKSEGDLTPRESQLLDWLYRGRDSWAAEHLLPDEMIGNEPGTERPSWLWASDAFLAGFDCPEWSDQKKAYEGLRRSVQRVCRSLERHGSIESITKERGRRAYRYRAGSGQRARDEREEYGR
ncbi:MAG: hypothetical protein AAFU73_23060 [Planctomycetota bacterium]